MTRKEAEYLATAEQIAQDFGVSERSIRNYADTGMPKEGHGKYDRLKCLLWYTQKLKADLEAAINSTDLEFEQTRVQRATADIKEMEAAEKRGQLIPVSVYRQHVAKHFIAVRQNYLALPSAIAPQLEGLDRVEIKTRLRNKVNEILSAIAEGTYLQGTQNGSPADSSADIPNKTESGAVRAQSRTGKRASKDRQGTGGAPSASTRHRDKRVGRKKPDPKKRHK